MLFCIFLVDITGGYLKTTSQLLFIHAFPVFCTADAPVSLGALSRILHRERKPTPILTKFSPKIHRTIPRTGKLYGSEKTSTRVAGAKETFWLVTVGKIPKTPGSESWLGRDDGEEC